MNRLRLTPSLLLLTVSAALAQPPRPVIVNAVTDLYRPVALSQETLTGVLADRIRANREGYLEHAKPDGSANSFDGFSGAFLDAAAGAYEYHQEQRLKLAMDATAKLLISKLASTETSNQVNASVERSDLLGLLAYYRVTGDVNTLNLCKKLGNRLMQAAAAANENFGRGFALEPIVELYRYTGDDRYLTFATSLAAGLRRVDASVKISAYEKLASLIGLLELYRITGDEPNLRSVVAGWNAMHSQTSVTGTLTNGSELADLCVTAAWMQLNMRLLRITADPRYAQQLERTTYNQLFASQDSGTGAIFSNVQFNGNKKVAARTDECTPNEARAISVIPHAVWGRWGNGIVVMLYSAGRATFQLRRRATVQVYSEANFPEAGDILLHIEPNHDVQFPLRLRVPEWASKFVVDVGGFHVIGDPGEFVTINRQWKRGDTVKIAVNLPVRIIDGGTAFPDQIAIQRGPQILAIGKALNPDVDDLSAARPRSTNPAQLKLTSQGSGLPANSVGDQAYTIMGEYKGRTRQLILAPFADSLNYRVWMFKPGASSGAN